MHTSDQIDMISSSLVDAQAELRDLTKDTQGYGYRYATLDQLLGLVRPILTAHRIAILQDVQADIVSAEQCVVVTTRLQHDSGQFIESSGILSRIEPRKGLSEMQCFGMNVTYSRRYQLQALLGITAEEDSDAAKKEDVAKSTLTGQERAARVAAMSKGRAYPRRGDPDHGVTEAEEDRDRGYPPTPDMHDVGF